MPIFLGEGAEQKPVPNDQQHRIFIQKVRLLESSAADNAVASSVFFPFSYCGAFLSLRNGEEGVRLKDLGGGRGGGYLLRLPR